MAFGKIGIDRQSFWAMTPREFFNAWQGWSESETERMEAMQSIIFGAARYNAANTAMSSDASKAISRQKFPWEQKKQEPQHISPDDKIEAFLMREDRRLNHS